MKDGLKDGGLKARAPGIAPGWAHIFSGDVVWCKSPCQRVFGKGNPLGVCKVNIISVWCVSTTEGKGTAPKAGVFLCQNRADLLPWRGQGLNRSLSGVPQAGGCCCLGSCWTAEKKLESHYKACKAACSNKGQIKALLCWHLLAEEYFLQV